MICPWRADQIIDLRDTDKSPYFAITEFNNCFIIRSPSFFINEYLREAKRSAIFHARAIARRRKAWFDYALAGYHLQPNTVDDMHEQIIICRQLFAGHVVGFQPMRRTKNLHRMIMPIMRLYSLVKELVVK